MQIEVLFFKFKDKPGGYFFCLNEYRRPDMSSAIDGRHDEAAADRYRRCLDGAYYHTAVEPGQMLIVDSSRLPTSAASFVDEDISI